jgi:alkylation response protein AidB-like acyl-CoA dehydrogenase
MDKQDDLSVIQPGDKIIADRFHFRPDDKLSAEEVAKLTPQIVIERVRALKSFFEENAEANEKLGRPSDEVWRALIKTGFMYMAVPKRFGGIQASLEEIIEATTILGEADGALCWVAMFVVNTPRQASGYPIAAQEILYKDSNVALFTNLISPTGTAKKVKGGYLVSGRWAWCTTIQMTNWLSMFAQVINEDGSKGPMWSFLAPNTSDAVTIVETWTAHGMVGTGTHHVVAKDLFVPDTMVAGTNNSEAAWGAQNKDSFPDYKMFHTPPAAHGSVCIAAICMASAKGAVEYSRRRLIQYNKRGSVVPEREKMSMQIRLAKASALAKAAELLVREGARVLFSDVTGPGADEKDEFHMIRAWQAEAAEISRQVVTMLMQSMGTSVHYAESPIGRAFRDVHVGSSHGATDYDAVILGWGQKMLGLAPKKRAPLGERNLVRNEVAARAGDYTRTTGNHVDISPI